MTELREDSPEPPASGDRTRTEDNPWLPPELNLPNADRQVEEPPSPLDQDSGAASPSPQEGFGAPPPPAQEGFGAPPPSTQEGFGASPPPPAPVSQPPVTDPPGPLPTPTLAPRPRIRWPRMRKRSLPSRSRPSGVRPRGVVVAIIALILVGAAGFAIGAASKSEKSDSTPTAIYRQLETTFTLEKARFQVQPANDKRWAEEMRRTEGAQAGKRWIAVAVSMRNLGRARLRPRSLGYRIVLPSGFVIGPELAELDRTALDAGGLLGKGGRTSVHLGFRVPIVAHDVSLAFEAAGIREPSVRVLLGAEG